MRLPAKDNDVQVILGKVRERNACLIPLQRVLTLYDELFTCYTAERSRRPDKLESPRHAQDGARSRECEAGDKVLLQVQNRQLQDALYTHQLEKDLQSLKQQKQTLIDENTSLRESVAKCQTQVTTLQQRVEELNSTIRTLRIELDALRTKLDTTSTENAKLTDLVISCKKDLVDMMNTNVALENEVIKLRESKRGGSVVEGGTRAERSLLGFNRAEVCSGRQGPEDTLHCTITAAPVGRAIHDLSSAHDAEINTATFHGDRLITGSSDKTIALHQGITGTRTHTFQATGSVQVVKCHADLLAAACSDNTTRVYGLSTMRPKFQLTGHSDGVTALSLSPDSERAITGSRDRIIKQWDIKERGGVIWSRPCFSLCHDVSYDVHGGAVLLSVHFDTTIRIWDPRAGTVTSEIPHAHEQSLTCIINSPRSAACFATLARDHILKLWDLRTKKSYKQSAPSQLMINHNACRMCYSPCGWMILVGGKGGATVFSEMGDGCALVTKLPHCKNSEAAGHLVNAVAWSQDGRWTATAGSDRRIVLWN